MSNITTLLENNSDHYDFFVTAGKVAKEQDLSCYLVVDMLEIFFK